MSAELGLLYNPYAAKYVDTVSLVTEILGCRALIGWRNLVQKDDVKQVFIIIGDEDT